MGTHRASIKIKMEFHGVKDDCDMYINYLPTECCGMDERVIDFFSRIYEKGMEKYDRQMDRYWEKRHKIIIGEQYPFYSQISDHWDG